MKTYLCGFADVAVVVVLVVDEDNLQRLALREEVSDRRRGGRQAELADEYGLTSIMGCSAQPKFSHGLFSAYTAGLRSPRISTPGWTRISSMSWLVMLFCLSSPFSHSGHSGKIAYLGGLEG